MISNLPVAAGSVKQMLLVTVQFAAVTAVVAAAVVTVAVAVSVFVFVAATVANLLSTAECYLVMDSILLDQSE